MDRNQQVKTFVSLSLIFAASAAFAVPTLTEFRFDANGTPAFIGRNDLPVGQLSLQSTERADKTAVTVSIKGTDTSDLAQLRLGPTVGQISGDTVTFQVPVHQGLSTYTVYAVPSKTADLRRKIVIEGVGVRIGSLVTSPNQAVTDVGRNSRNFRIPGIVETPKGTLVAVFDNRFNHPGDLPADITVGVSTSTDGGTTWSPIRTALNCEGYDGGVGVGDPCVLVDPSNGRIWIAGLRSPKSGHPIWRSVKGSVSPADCGQFILAYSDDEGQTWSKPINITLDVKRPNDPDTKDWGCLFQGPGAGIAMADGTLVFPAQIWGHNGGAPHHGVLVYSKDHGQTWTSSAQMPFGGSESTVAEIEPGVLLLNTREGMGAASRTSAITRDMGKTWEKLETTPLRQPGNLCQAALLKIGERLYFSNPNAWSRSAMSIRTSDDKGKTWSAGLIYDPRACAGYSSLCTVGEDSIGVIYEGNSDYHYFLRIPLKDFE